MQDAGQADELAVAVAPLAQIALTAFLVNSRHVFYTLSFPLHQVTGAAGKTYSTFAVVAYLSARMPLGVMVILLAYILRNLPLGDPGRALPDILALAATVGLHLWRRNAVLSIVGGTAIHVALTTAFPVH